MDKQPSVSTVEREAQRAPSLSEARAHDVESRLARHLAALRRHHRPKRSVNEELAATLSPLERVALAVTQRVGTFGFFLIIFGWTAGWLAWNLLAPRGLRFDPAPAFVTWLFLSNMIQIMLMPLIMVGQNLQGRHAELRAEQDFAINQQSEREVETILLQLERQTGLLDRQTAQLRELTTRLDGLAESINPARR